MKEEVDYYIDEYFKQARGNANVCDAIRFMFKEAIKWEPE